MFNLDTGLKDRAYLRVVSIILKICVDCNKRVQFSNIDPINVLDKKL